MSDERRASGWAVTRSATWLAGGRVASQVLSVALTIVLARGLGTIGFGQYAFAGAIVLIANTLTSFGTDSLLIREIAGGREDASRLAARALVLQLLLSFASVAVIVAGAGALPNQSPETVAALRVYSLCLLPLAFFSVYSAALRGWERMDLYARLNVGTAALHLGAALVGVTIGGRLSHVMVALVLSQVGAALLGWRLCRVAHPGFALLGRTTPFHLGRMFASTWSLALLSGLSILSQRIGVVLLSSLAGDAPAGWFAAAGRVVEGLKLGNYAVSGAMLPVASRLSGRPGDEPSLVAGASLTRLLRGSRLVLLGIAALAAVAATTFAHPVVALFFGRGYEPAVTALRILAWTLIPEAIATLGSLALVSAGLERLAALAFGLGVAVTTALGLWWNPSSGLSGACAAVLVGESVRATALMIGDRRRLSGSRPRYVTGKSLRELDS